MKKERFDFVCQDVESGNDAFVRHPSTNEEGLVSSCAMTHLTVNTSEGKTRCWDYNECEELSRSGEEWPRR